MSSIIQIKDLVRDYIAALNINPDKDFTEGNISYNVRARFGSAAGMQLYTEDFTSIEVSAIPAIAALTVQLDFLETETNSLEAYMRWTGNSVLHLENIDFLGDVKSMATLVTALTYEKTSPKVSEVLASRMAKLSQLPGSVERDLFAVMGVLHNLGYRRQAGSIASLFSLTIYGG